jgi:hypothetical protein
LILVAFTSLKFLHRGRKRSFSAESAVCGFKNRHEWRSDRLRAATDSPALAPHNDVRATFDPQHLIDRPE